MELLMRRVKVRVGSMAEEMWIPKRTRKAHQFLLRMCNLEVLIVVVDVIDLRVMEFELEKW